MHWRRGYEQEPHPVVYPRNGLLIETIGNVVRAPLIVPAEGRL